MHSRTTSILAITENRGEGFDAVQRAPHAKSIRLPCDRYSHLRVPSSKFTVHSTSDTLREVVFVHFDFVSIYIQKQSDIRPKRILKKL